MKTYDKKVMAAKVNRLSDQLNAVLVAHGPRDDTDSRSEIMCALSNVTAMAVAQITVNKVWRGDFPADDMNTASRDLCVGVELLLSGVMALVGPHYLRLLIDASAAPNTDNTGNGISLADFLSSLKPAGNA